MSATLQDAPVVHPPTSISPARQPVAIPIASKLLVSFLLVSIISNIFFTAVGIRFIGDRIVSEAQERIRTDLNAAREIYLGELRHISDVVRITSRRPILPELLLTGPNNQILDDLINAKDNENLDFLTVTDTSGAVVLRSNYPYKVGDDLRVVGLVSLALCEKQPVEGATILPAAVLQKESAVLARQAQIEIIDTPMARPRSDTEVTTGMVLAVAAPVFDTHNTFLGVLFGGVLLNHNFVIVDKIKQTVFQNLQYKGRDIGTATIFQDDVRISTNVLNADGTRALGTRVAQDVYERVMVNRQSWVGRAYVVNNWYISAYEPLLDENKQVIGILYVGILEQKYTDLRQNAILSFLVVSLAGMLVSTGIAFYLSRSILIPVKRLVTASQELANGNLAARVQINTRDELGKLADSFNTMAEALKDHEDKLKEYTRRKFMESERLALIGQLAANVAHELNNPLQGIVTYSHLILENTACDEATRQSLQKIVTQADRCRTIIRSLLDFSRQRKPDKLLANLNALLLEAMSLLENQALFHNIEVVWALDKDLPMTVIDPSQLVRVFLNLMVNAAEAMDGKGRLTIASRRDPEIGCLEITVSDTGSGIREEHIDQIFDPFFTTKEVGRGVGLGLAISYGIIKEHKGSITVESEVGKGTMFIIHLPTIREENCVKNGHPA